MRRRQFIDSLSSQWRRFLNRSRLGCVRNRHYIVDIKKLNKKRTVKKKKKIQELLISNLFLRNSYSPKVNSHELVLLTLLKRKKTSVKSNFNNNKVETLTFICASDQCRFCVWASVWITHQSSSPSRVILPRIKHPIFPSSSEKQSSRSSDAVWWMKKTFHEHTRWKWSPMHRACWWECW